MHTCDNAATRIADPVAWATATATILEDPRVKAALATPPDRTSRALNPIDDIPIRDILGDDGPQACSGSRRSIEGFESEKAAYDNARDWTKAHREKLLAGATDWDDAATAVASDPRFDHLVVPRSEPISSFEGGTFLVGFKSLPDRSGHRITTICPMPPPRESSAQRSADETKDAPA